ncbi:TRAP-type transport system, small permease component [Lachnospiraceae bacterium JC7]|nr:TRAP-type transport system, small permease component [Lachnospiraceae bacterium JC7]
MRIIKWMDKHLEELILSVLLSGIAVVMILQVICRYGFNYSLSWSDELARYLLVWSTFLSVSFCIKNHISIKIDQFQNMLPEDIIPWIKMLRHTLVFIFSLIMIPYTLTLLRQSVSSHATSAALRIPMYYIQSAPLVCFSLLALRTLEAWIKEFKKSSMSMLKSVFDGMKPKTLAELKAEEEKEKAEWKQLAEKELGGESDTALNARFTIESNKPDMTSSDESKGSFERYESESNYENSAERKDSK